LHQSACPSGYLPRIYTKNTSILRYSRTLIRSPSTTSRSASAAAAGMCSTAPWRSEMTLTRTSAVCPRREEPTNRACRYALASVATGRVKAVVFDYGHTIVDFRRTEEALLEAYRRIRERIEAALEIEAPEVG